jgi:hypothetical protein
MPAYSTNATASPYVQFLRQRAEYQLSYLQPRYTEAEFQRLIDLEVLCVLDSEEKQKHRRRDGFKILLKGLFGRRKEVMGIWGEMLGSELSLASNF